MKPGTYRTDNEDETINLGRKLAAEISRPAVILLIGNLGAGKTTLSKGIVEGLGAVLRDDVSSPTFTLIHDYGSAVFHVDLYRLETEREVASLGLEELFDTPRSVVLVEWGERFPYLFPPNRVEIAIAPEGDSRDVTVRPSPLSRSTAR